MRILPSGNLEVTASEEITVKVVKSIKPYAASISDLIGATWETTSRPDDLTEVRTFQAPTAPGSKVFCTIVFDFAPDAEGAFDPRDKYTVEIIGNPAEDTRTSTIVPPPIVSRTFIFVVRG
jgi:hypothetical protein